MKNSKPSLDILTPKKSLPWLSPKSAICGSETPENPKNSYTIDFEGNIYGACNLESFEDKLLRAIFRHIKKYPTKARLQAPREFFEENFEKVGTIDIKALTTALENKTKSQAECLQKNCLIFDKEKLAQWTKKQ
jgi:hypothetical protein